MSEFALFPLPDEVLLPFAVLQIDLNLDNTQNETLFTYLSRHTTKDLYIATVPTRSDTTSGSNQEARGYLGKLGVLARVLQLSRSPGSKRAALVLEGQQRFHVVSMSVVDGVEMVMVKWISLESTLVTKEMKHRLLNRTRRLIELMARKGREGSIRLLMESLEKMTPGEAADAIGCVLASSYNEKESLLITLDIKQRIQLVVEMVEKAIQLVENAVSTRKANQWSNSPISNAMEVQSKDELQELREKIVKKNPPVEVLEVVEREVKKLQRTNEMHPSYTMARSYLETLSRVPFNQFTPGAQENIHHASKELDSGHFGLFNAKKRILEYVAVQKLKQGVIRGPILCFVGPPGVGNLSLTLVVGKNSLGKTSLAKGMAKALGRKYVRVSLGGVRDEAEIRGHRRTYIGSMPGRIINGICQIGVCDCVMLLDELDKMGHDFRGNPAAALLEVLDPEQNHAFIDTYLGVPVDLSHVIFLATANSLMELPAALLDRLEVIKLTGYTLHEKIKIAQTHLIPKVIQENGLKALFQANKLEIPAHSLEFIIENYTMEVGVRNLERCLSSICRHCATMLVEKFEKRDSTPSKEKLVGVLRRSTPSTNENHSNSSKGLLPTPWRSTSSLLYLSPLLSGPYLASSQHPPPLKPLSDPDQSAIGPWCSMEKILIDERLVEMVLGPPKQRFQEPKDHLDGAGVAAGLVWTPLGGSVQYIECCITNWRPIPEQGDLKLTGQLGDVLEESAQIALSWIKSNSHSLYFPTPVHHPEASFLNCDVHIHFPSGGIQKDGPSAGITLAVALVSLFSGRAVRADTAMTGELSLRGMVLPIGGLKEKLMAAHQAGLKRVIVPDGNKQEIKHDIPEEVLQSVEICTAKKLEDVLLLAFQPPYDLNKQSKM